LHEKPNNYALAFVDKDSVPHMDIDKLQQMHQNISNILVSADNKVVIANSDGDIQILSDEQS
jgi:hypothetical protein